MQPNMYRVQLWPNGRWDRQPWRVVVAKSDAEAAYKATGELLEKADLDDDRGLRVKLRARVIRSGAGQPIAFYSA
jgi:hypothetical protein